MNSRTDRIVRFQNNVHYMHWKNVTKLDVRLEKMCIQRLNNADVEN